MMMDGRRHTEETKRKMSKSHTLRYLDPEQRRITSEANRDRPCSKETREKMALNQIGEDHHAFKGWYCIGDTKFSSALAAGNSIGLTAGAVQYRTRSNADHWSDYTFINKDDHEHISKD